ncbi:MAG: serine/threonine protein kinase [Labilithrix sp.]|nr:serine/threonine protein kinase [Labilithrix sp.]
MRTHESPDSVRRSSASSSSTIYASAERITPEPGETLVERYRLDSEVARTEAGVVFDAVDLALNRRVAVELASSIEEPKARRKWTRDAMLAQRLEGVHVLRVLDVGTTQTGVPFVVRESALCTLASELEAKGALPMAQAVGWTLEACEAVAEAHALGMAHGDLRLDNMYLARATPEPIVKVAWTTAAKAERAAREDVARDIAGLGVMLRVLATGHVTADDGAATLPRDLAHAVARALAQDPDGAFQTVSALARALAPYAPQGNTSARNVAFLLSRTRDAAGLSAPAGAIAPAANRASITDEWFGRPSRTSLVEQVAPPPKHRGAAFALVSIALIALVLGGSWLLWHDGKLPRWTGAAPPESVGTAEVTNAPVPPPENATDDATENATNESANAQPDNPAGGTAAAAPAPAATAVESLPNAAAPATEPETTPARPQTAAPRAAQPPTDAASKAKSELRYVDPQPSASETEPSNATPFPTPGPSSTSTSATDTETAPSTIPPLETREPLPAPSAQPSQREPGGIY